MQAPLDPSFDDPSADGEVQFNPAPGLVDLAWGHPDPTLLPTQALAAATDRVLTRRGWHALAYGQAAGALSLREPLAAHLSATDAPTHPDQLVITGGASGAMDLLLTVSARPGDVVFVQRPTYFLALRLFADHDLEVVGLDGDTDGPDPEALAAACRSLGDRRGFLYLVSVHANPTGRCLPPQRAEALLDVAARHALTVIDDDVYRDTAPASPPSLLARAGDAGVEVVRFGSFSKVVSPGLRLGHLTASPALVARIADCGLLDSGGGVNHFAAVVAGELMSSGAYGVLVQEAGARYAERRMALAGALDREVFSFEVPAGGYFLWIGLAGGLGSAALAAAAAHAGVGLSNGDVFFPGNPPGDHIRLSFSLYGPETLVAAATTLGEVARTLRR